MEAWRCRLECSLVVSAVGPVKWLDDLSDAFVLLLPDNLSAKEKKEMLKSAPTVCSAIL